MPRKKGMVGGPGAGVMGGAGAKPRTPPTAMPGRAARPPMTASPAGALGPVPGGQPRMGGGGGGGMGGAAGFKKGGHAEKHEEEKSKKYARGGEVGRDEDKGSKREAFAKGGAVGSDSKGRVGRDTGHAGKSA